MLVRVSSYCRRSGHTEQTGYRPLTSTILPVFGQVDEVSVLMSNPFPQQFLDVGVFLQKLSFELDLNPDDFDEYEA